LTAPPDDDGASVVASVLRRYRPAVERGLRDAVDAAPAGFGALVREHFGWDDAAASPGKLLRPVMCLLVAEALGAPAERALPAAVGIELVHNFTLIHDDIEDHSDIRHGRPALWRTAGLPLALNAGDGLFALARRTLLALELPPDRVLRAARLLDDACIALCEGQHLDLSSEARPSITLAEYEAMVAGKTAALLAAAMALGALAAGAGDAAVDAVHACGCELGMAFQIQDDVLGIWGEAADTGKPVADDIRARKKSFPVVWAREHASPDDARRLDALYATPPGEPAVAEVLALLDRAAAREAATTAARTWAERALARLAGMTLAPQREAELRAIGAYFVTRRA
jgi:geranylgeranyl diphosphate synthase type I